jgi:hypothetical protein
MVKWLVKHRDSFTFTLTNRVVAEPEGSTQLIQKLATKHDPEPALSSQRT